MVSYDMWDHVIFTPEVLRERGDDGSYSLGRLARGKEGTKGRTAQ
jgi:hypothetical protein